MNKLGILISGRGSNFMAIARNVEAGKIPAHIAVVVSNREDAPGLEKARESGIPALALTRRARDRESYDNELAVVLEKHGVDLVCLAGFMHVLGPAFVRRFPMRILNIHPALLPSFPGLNAQQQALDYGVKVSGCTVHLVDEGVDTGPILVQAAVPVLEGDTVESLSARILVQEHRIYSEAICLMLEGRIRIEGRRVFGSS